MKRFTRLLLVVAMMTGLLMPSSTQAGNNYLNNFDSYSVMSMGNNVLRFTIPVWVYGKGDDRTYYLEPHSENSNNQNDSYLWFSEEDGQSRGSDKVQRIVSFGAMRNPNYDGNKAGGVGYAFALVDDNSGSVIISNTYDGVPLTLTAGDRSHWIVNNTDEQSWDNVIRVTRMNTSYTNHVVYLQIDWYIPERLQEKNFYIGLNVRKYRVGDNKAYEDCWWQWGTKYYGGDIPQSPQLFEPYFYSVLGNGVNTLGKAAMQYITFHDPISYHTSLSPSVEMPIEDRSGSILVDMQDTVQDYFSANFNVWINKEAKQSQRITSNKVLIPAYHRIYNMSATEVLDAQNSSTGDVNVEWHTKYPDHQDILESDMFELQRATQEDFSDAQTIGALSLMNDSSTYIWTDEAKDVLALFKSDSLYGTESRMYLSATQNDMEMEDPTKGFFARIHATLRSHIIIPGATLYYRVRRASAAAWGWNETPYMATTSVIKANYLAPLAATQADYTLDPEFEDNRTVHFHFLLDNAEITPITTQLNETNLRYSVDMSSVTGVPVPVTIQHTSGAYLSRFTFVITQDYNGVQSIITPRIEGQYMFFDALSGSTVQVQAAAADKTNTISFTVPSRGKQLVVEATYAPLMGMSSYKISSSYDYNSALSEEELEARVRPYLDTTAIKAQLFPALQAKANSLNTSGRCVWDRNADLVLTRRIVETGAVREIRVPKDSIFLQQDGSYIAHVTDVANLSCAHYEYSVRIDQTNALLQVQYATQLNPVPIHGPELYTNSSARIASFEATDGTDKRGVVLTWQPTAGSIDYYTLERREQGSEAVFDTLAILEQEDYFDEHKSSRPIVPGRAYEYRLTSSFTCNGNTTTDTKTAIGRRSPYGSIAGRVAYEDGSGCYGVEVKLSSEGADDIKMLTDERGAFLFDSLLYGTSTTYSVTPTSQTAEFRFNNTSSPTATITLTADNNVAEDLGFANISSVRFSGRVLYKLSSVPVRDANILLNGKLVKKAGDAVKTDVSGNFNISVPKNAAFTLQIVKEGHTFEGDGFVRIDGDSLLTLTKALDGVRVWDQTKVRLSGRVIGGLDQAQLPLGQGLSRNNLGDNIRLVLELEGDNISYIVRDPDDLTKDTLEYAVGTTRVHYQHKRIVIEPDSLTGEYEADLFPVKYKIVQATAQGYSTLFAQGKTSETVDLSNTRPEIFSITYRTPIEVTYKQTRYGLDYDYYGMKTWTAQALNGEDVKVDLVTQDSTGQWNYLFGAPVFPVGTYQFRVSAHEDYYYNNDRTNIPDRVYLRGGNLKVYNGMRQTTQIFTQPLDAKGQALVNVLFDHVTYVQTGDDALHSLDFSVESEGEFVNSQPMQAYVLGAVEKPSDFMEIDTTETGITLLDILRDPPGSGSFAYLEKGTSYHVQYKHTYNYRFGINLTFKWGNNSQYFVGTYAGTPAGGATAGIVSTVQKTTDWGIPLAVQWHGYTQSEYDFKTTERIQTSSGLAGSIADVYIGVTNGVMTGKADAFRVVDSVSYEMLKAQIDNRNVRVVQQGVSADGKPWYLMRTEDVLLKQGITSSFTYTQQYITGTVIPELFYRRNSLLMTGSRADAEAYANSRNQHVYWSTVPADSLGFGEEGYYEIIKPEGYTRAIIDQVQCCNRAIDNWIGVIATNEAEKAMSFSDAPLHTYSITGGVTQSYSESYAYTDTRSAYFALPWNNQTGFGVSSTTTLSGNGAIPFAVARLKGLFSGSGLRMLINHLNRASTAKDPAQYVRAEVGSVKFDFDYKPIIEVGYNILPENNEKIGSSKTTGYTIALDLTEHLTFEVYKSKTDDFNSQSRDIREEAHDLNSDNKDKYLFGSLMYRTLGGATRCPWEDADSTYFYNPGTPLNLATQKIENPQIVINRHEISNVPHDQPARFAITMWNEADETVGLAGAPRIEMNLLLVDSTNPKGAKISIDGVPLSDGRTIIFNGSTPITKIVEVAAGEAYDYENISLILASKCMPAITYQKVSFSVHYMPVSCPVSISSPSDKWIMNTLSPRDEQGYYMPVSIDGFDVNYDGFNHIELQYKLVTQPNDAWVNLCSYYADDSLYNAASGTKAMIVNGKIADFRFYGERDPIEQQYDLRAVSFCRHGSSFITKSSPILTGTKDTRNPRIFGEPEPANAILGVGDNLLLRFNEPIAGNYLDEDNNFQITGYTNESGITTGTSLHFDGTENSYAESQVMRSLFDKSFTIDMLVRPTDPDQMNFLLINRSDERIMHFVLSQNRIGLGYNFFYNSKSLPFPEPMTGFTRVVASYDHTTRRVRYFVGTQEITDPDDQPFEEGARLATGNAPICIGQGFEGNIMEVRLWTKALTADEVALTHMKRLTGYERELMAYYPMNEGEGTALADKANGATLYTHGANWEHQKGISLHLNAGQQVQLNGNLLSRSDKQDETLMFWYKTDQPSAVSGQLFSAGWVPATDSTDAQGTLIAFEDGKLVLHSANSRWLIANGAVNGAWHHLVLTVNRTHNNVSVYFDDELRQTFAATKFGGISGAMFFGGGDFSGNIDEFVIFEQALPKTMMESFGQTSPVGDEMGLMAYLPFVEMKENANGIYEQVFSINDRRIFRDANGNVVQKVVPLVLNQPGLADLADKAKCAPVEDHGQFTKMNFDWSFNSDELMINLNMLDREINKQTIYVTVRDVEDLNGNPMLSPVTWTAYVDRNPLKWAKRQMQVSAVYGNLEQPITRTIRVINNSGKRHQFTIESLPDWLKIDATNGAVEPVEEVTLTFSFDNGLAPGIYENIIYLTDENGLSEPLRVALNMEAIPPYDAIDKNKYPLNMSVCAQVLITAAAGDTIYDSDSRDIVYAFYRNECVGMANIEFDNIANTSELFLTVYGNDDMTGKRLNFKLWQASTGKLLNLTTGTRITFAHGSVYGCNDGEPIRFVSSGSETQPIVLQPGWNWVSFNLNLQPATAQLSRVLSSNDPWTEGDLIKNPATRHFVTYSEEQDDFIGDFSYLRYIYTYMVYCKNGNTMYIRGNTLPADSMHITLRGNGKWNALPCLLSTATPIAEALAGYYDHATPGDIVKSHDHFAYLSADKKWKGDLKVLRPGEGYFLRRMGEGTVDVKFYNSTASNAPAAHRSPVTAPRHATNMTMIARVDGHQPTSADQVIRAYIGDELVGEATPIVVDGEQLYFLTISADAAVELRFETADGTPLTSEMPISYVADCHHGSLKAPIILRPTDNRPYKIIENDHVIIIRNNEKYDITGQKL